MPPPDIKKDRSPAWLPSFVSVALLSSYRSLFYCSFLIPWLTLFFCPKCVSRMSGSEASQAVPASASAAPTLKLGGDRLPPPPPATAPTPATGGAAAPTASSAATGGAAPAAPEPCVCEVEMEMEMEFGPSLALFSLSLLVRPRSSAFFLFLDAVYRNEVYTDVRTVHTRVVACGVRSYISVL